MKLLFVFPSLLGLLGLLGLAACAGQQLTPPLQPTGPSVKTAFDELGVLQDIDGEPLPPLTTWQVADGSVRTACHAYLNAAAMQQQRLSLGQIGVGMLGAGLSMVNPLAGVASSLVQTLIAAYSSSGYVPTTADAILVENYLNAYELSAGIPTSNAQAISWADDEWYHCSAGGIAVLAMQAKITAQMSVIGPTQAFYSRFGTAPSRPIVIINGH